MLGALIAGGLAAAGTAVSAISSARQAKKNRESQERENAITRSREDNAYQRAVSDARSAGLSPLSVAGTGGASSQALTAPQMETDIAGRAISSGSQVFQDILNQRSVDGQIAMNNAQIAKLVEETRGQSISNAYSSADYQARILKLLSEVDNINTDTSKQQIFKEQYRERLQQELKNAQSLGTQRDISNATAQGSLDFNKEIGLNPSTSWSSTTGGFLADTARLETYRAMKANQKSAANAKAADEVLRSDYESYKANAVKSYNVYLKDWEQQMKRAREQAKKSNSSSDAAYFKKLQKSKPNYSDYVLSFEEYKKQRMSR